LKGKIRAEAKPKRKKEDSVRKNVRNGKKSEKVNRKGKKFLNKNSAQIITNIQEKCEQTAKMLGVALAFFIPISTTLTQILLVLIFLALCGAGQWRAPIQFLSAHPVARVGMMLVIIFCLSMIYTEATFKDSLGMLTKMSKMIYIPLLLPLFLEVKWRKYAIFAFLMAMLLSLTLSSLKTYHALPAFISLTRYHDCAFKNHIDTNLLMSMAVFFLAHFMWLEANRFRKMIMIILLICMTFYVLWISEGRTGYIVFAALWLLWLLQRATFKQCMMGLTGLIAILAATIFTPSGIQQRFNSMLIELKHYQLQPDQELKENNTQPVLAQNQHAQMQDQKPTVIGKSVRQRLEFIQSSFAVAKQKPWFGRGTGGFKSAYATYAQEHHIEATTNPHNEYLNILVQWGLLGLLALFVFVWTVFKTSFLLPTLEKYLAQGVIFGILVGCMGNSFLMDFTPGYFFVVFISITMAAMPLSSVTANSTTLRFINRRKIRTTHMSEGLLS
jgi:O-antigen ligase